MADKKKIEIKSEDHPQGTYETRDVDFKKLMYVGVGLIAIIILMLAANFLLSGFLGSYSSNPGAPADVVASGAPDFPTPRLQPNPVLDLKELREHEDSVLSTYGWSDRRAGLVRVPIDTAMDLLLKHGLPVYAEGKK
ncbi:MAG TPA: hypothetical protein VMM58_08905 [Bacteroidota bacterium]|nr:hypothetical protein [Bacteroidota bacterium]